MERNHLDLNNDGKNDLIVGNHGLNSRFNASKSKPLRLYYNDFDKNAWRRNNLF